MQGLLNHLQKNPLGGITGPRVYQANIIVLRLTRSEIPTQGITLGNVISHVTHLGAFPTCIIFVH